MVVGFFGLLLGLFYLGVIIFMLWLVWRVVTALEQTAAAQERSANTLAEISKKLDRPM
jgi:Tfp pilus assembly protein PilW